MAYADLLQQTAVEESFLINLRPKFRVDTFSVFSGFVYVSDFDKSLFIDSVSVEGVALTSVSTTSLSSGEYFWDVDNGKLYVRTPADGDPNTVVTCVRFELFVATTDTKYHRDPTDTNTEIVFWEGLVQASPIIKETLSDSLFGFLPVQTSSITLANPQKEFEPFTYDVSYSKAGVRIYHVLREKLPTPTRAPIESANTKLVLDGLASDMIYKENQITIDLVSRVDDFDVEYRNKSTVDSFYTTDTFANLDPGADGKPVRYFYGRCEGVVPISIDWPADPSSPTTSDLRQWVVIGEQSNLPDITRTVQSGSTTTTILLNDATGFRAGDHVWVDKASDEYATVDSVNYVGNSIDVTPALSVAPLGGDFVKRFWVAAVEVERDETRYKLFPNRDYTVGTFSGGTSGFTLNSSAESNSGIPSALETSDRIWVTVYGRTNDVSIGGDDVNLGNMTSAYAIIYDLLVNRIGLATSEVDGTTLDTLASADDQPLGIAIPESSGAQFPKYRDVLAQLIQTKLIRLYRNNSNEWTVSVIGPGVANTDTISNSELTENSINWRFSYSDLISTVRVLYENREVSRTIGDTDSDDLIEISESSTAAFLHGVTRTSDFKSYHINSADASELADRLSFIFGDRRGIVTIKTADNQYHDNLIGEVTELQREAMPGFTTTEGTTRTRDLTLIEVSKGLSSIDLKFDDQKGIEDNSSSW